jgi:Photosynthetic reaction centre cytochrome C subunit
MKKLFFISLICITGILFISFAGRGNKTVSYKAPQDSLAVERGKFIAAILDSLKGKEKIAADSVFKNLQVFTLAESVPVTHFLAIMDYWGEALHVNCTYCHSSSDWSSDEMRTKRVARDMYMMRQTINHQILSAMKDIDRDRAEVNCVTCHNGKALPEN